MMGVGRDFLRSQSIISCADEACFQSKVQNKERMWLEEGGDRIVKPTTTRDIAHTKKTREVWQSEITSGREDMTRGTKERSPGPSHLLASTSHPLRSLRSCVFTLALTEQW